MAISTLFPTTRPSLSLDFAKSKRLDPRISFSRTTTGNIASYTDSNGLVRFAGPDEPRFDHNPTTGESLGLLVEEGRTNYFLWSESFISGWGGGGTLGSDTIANPTGQVGTVHYVTGSEWTRTYDVNGATRVSISFFAKKRFGGLERDYNRIEFFQVAVGGGVITTYDFRFDGNNIDTTYVKNVRTISYPNDWYRFEFQLLARSDYNGGIFSTSARFDIEGAASDNYIWGIQVEKDTDFSTSYIPTSGSAVTRPADSGCLIPNTIFPDLYNTSQGTAIWEGFSFAREITPQVGYRISTGVSLRGFGIQIDTRESANSDGANVTFRDVASGFTSFAIIPADGLFSTYSNIKSSTSWNVNSTAYTSLNGVDKTSTDGGSLSNWPSLIGTEDRLDIGRSGGISGSNNPFNGHIKQFKLYTSNVSLNTNTQLSRV